MIDAENNRSMREVCDTPHSILPREAFGLHHSAEVLCECSQSLACVYSLPTYP